MRLLGMLTYAFQGCFFLRKPPTYQTAGRGRERCLKRMDKSSTALIWEFLKWSIFWMGRGNWKPTTCLIVSETRVPVFGGETKRKEANYLPEIGVRTWMVRESWKEAKQFKGVPNFEHSKMYAGGSRNDRQGHHQVCGLRRRRRRWRRRRRHLPVLPPVRLNAFGKAKGNQPLEEKP